ncbi:deubiquitinating enzyme [Castilleja foliolosa]|uniref:Deubiquitinating enzyme n=1 Tax=Castilleja foliolosa TaxID=1961234 RepID=A0ABD3BRQ1_9LAMI
MSSVELSRHAVELDKLTCKLSMEEVAIVLKVSRTTVYPRVVSERPFRREYTFERNPRRGFAQALRSKYPQFAQLHNGIYLQQKKVDYPLELDDLRKRLEVRRRILRDEEGKKLGLKTNEKGTISPDTDVKMMLRRYVVTAMVSPLTLEIHTDDPFGPSHQTNRGEGSEAIVLKVSRTSVYPSVVSERPFRRVFTFGNDIRNPSRGIGQ